MKLILGDYMKIITSWGMTLWWGGRDSTGGRVLCEGQKNQFVRRKLNILIMYMANTKTALAKH